MTPSTRSRSPAAALEHVLDVLGATIYKNVFDGSGIKDVYDFLVITPKDLDEISIIDESATVNKLSIVQLRKVGWAQKWFQANNPADNSDYAVWFDLDSEKLKSFIISGGVKPKVEAMSSSTKSELLAGVKRNITDYPILREDKFWLSFHRSLRSMAATHAVSEVLEVTYSPTSPEEKALFKVKNTFMYSVFTRSLTTAKSRIHLRAHESTQDAQAVYKDLIKAFEDGTAATLSAESLETLLRGMKLDSGWNKTLETFLHTWSSRLHDLESVRDEEVSEADRRRWLIHAIKSHEALYQGVNTAKSVEQAMKNVSGFTAISWDQFFGLILDQAQVIDASTSKRKIRANRAIQSQGNNGKKKWQIPGAEWAKMSAQEKKEHIEKRREYYRKKKGQGQNRQQSNNNATTTTNNGTSDSGSAAPSATQSSSTTNTGGSTSNGTPSQSQGTVSDQAQRFLSQVAQAPASVVINGVTYRASATHITYHIQSEHGGNTPCGSLVDRGANGGLSGGDVRVLEESTTEFADVHGIADISVSKLPLCTVAGVIQTHQGPIIGIFHQYAHYGKGHTLHSPLQMEHFGLDVDERSSRLGKGKQQIVTPEGHVVPLSMWQGLMYMSLCPPSDEEMDELPHVTMTSDEPWDPSIYDEEGRTDVVVEDCDMTPSTSDGQEALWDMNALINRCILACKGKTVFLYTPKSILPKNPDFDKLRPLFAWIPASRVKDTISCTTQYYKADGRLPMRRHYKSRFPGANVPRRNETVATDTLFSDTPAHDDGIGGHGGCTMLQFYVGCTSTYAAGFPMSSETQVPKTLQDFIRHYGAPNALFNDNAKSEISMAIQDILRHYCMKQYRSEPKQQNQNPAERRIQEIKKHTNVILDRTGAPASMWLLCTLYIIQLHNHLAGPSLDNHITPIQKAFGYQPDISKFLQFHWWQRVLYKADSSNFPSQSYEGIGRFVGISDHVGDVLTYQILTDDTQQVIDRSMVRPLDPANPNIRVLHPQVEGEDSEPPIPVVHSLVDSIDPEYDPEKVKLPKFSPDELVGLTFLHDTQDGQRVRAEIVRRFETMESENHQNIKFVVKYGDPHYEELMSYAELSDIVEKQHEEEQNEDKLWTFKRIVSHHGPLKASDENYKGSKWNLRIEWEDGTMTYEPLNVIGRDDPAACASYAKEHDLLELDGWKRFRRLARRVKKMQRMMKQAAMASKRRAPIYKFGVQVPRNEKEARLLDEKNGNTKWADAEKKEVEQLNEYNSFESKGKGSPPPRGYKFIKVFFVYDVKHDLRHKARLVAGGHMTQDHGDSYSSVISLRGMRLAMLIGENNKLKTMVGDVGNAYLEAYTKEKVCFMAGAAFGDLEGHTMVIVKALYGLRTSGARYHERFADTLRDLGFFPCKNEPDLWMRDRGDHYEYICVYVDDLLAIMKNPQSFFDILRDKYKYKLKGVEEPKYHLGGNFERDPDGTLAWGANRYIGRMVENFEREFGHKPQTYAAPMDKDAHPELDESPPLDQKGVKQYQSLIGALQWCITLGRFDIACAVMTMGRFRAEPHENHMKNLEQILGYLRHTKDAAIRFRTTIPRHEDHYAPPKYDWSQSVYEGAEEEIPEDAPVAKGQPIRMTTYVDASLLHCKVTGRAASGILHMINETPVDWFSKRQNIVEAAVYGSEFMAARIATQQVIDLRLTLRYMGVALDGPTWMFGDNESVIKSSTIPASTLNKRHNALSYHTVRAAIASNIIKFMHVPGVENIADVLTKHVQRPVAKPLITPYLFRKGPLIKAIEEEEKEEEL